MPTALSTHIGYRDATRSLFDPYIQVPADVRHVTPASKSKKTDHGQHLLAIILFCTVSFRQRKVSVFKAPPRHNHYLLRFVSEKHLATKNKPYSYCDYYTLKQ